MKIKIVNPTINKRYDKFGFIHQILHNSLKDLGHSFTEVEDADIIISIRTGEREKLKISKEQKFVFLQTEPYKVSPNFKQEIIQYGPYPFSRFNADMYWGFDKYDENERYLILGYHPLFDFTSKGITIPRHPLGFLGSITDRRKEVFNKSKLSVTSCNTWNTEKGIYLSQQCKINIHMNAWDRNEALTPWDRIARYLLNKCFFIMEDVCDCPINQVIRFDLPDYESTINKYINNDKLRQDIAEECYIVYKRDFDMRNILQQKIEELYDRKLGGK